MPENKIEFLLIALEVQVFSLGNAPYGALEAEGVIPPSSRP